MAGSWLRVPGRTRSSRGPGGRPDGAGQPMALAPLPGGQAGEAVAELADPLDHRQRDRDLRRHAERAADQDERRFLDTEGSRHRESGIAQRHAEALDDEGIDEADGMTERRQRDPDLGSAEHPGGPVAGSADQQAAAMGVNGEDGIMQAADALQRQARPALRQLEQAALDQPEQAE